jgi:hypothetical protein
MGINGRSGDGIETLQFPAADRESSINNPEYDRDWNNEHHHLTTNIKFGMGKKPEKEKSGKSDKEAKNFVTRGI